MMSRRKTAWHVLFLIAWVATSTPEAKSSDWPGFNPYPPAPFKKQGILEDRLDSIGHAATACVESPGGRHLYQAMRQYGELTPVAKNLIHAEVELQNAIRNLELLESQLDSLKRSYPSGKSALNRRVADLEGKIREQKYQLANAQRSRDAAFKAKIFGAGLTAVSLYFQLMNIRDALRRVKIKEADLLSRKDALAKDAKKLEILKRNYETASENVKTLKARAGSRPGAARLSEIQRAEQSLLDRFHELDQWDDVMKRSAQKILDAEETTLIDKRSIARQRISVGITTIGVLVIGLFGDRIFLKIQEWLESDDPREQEKDVLAFLQDWNKVHPRVIEASLLPWFSRREVNPLEKSVVFFMNSRQLGVRTGVLERALARYKRLDPHGYAQLQGTAEAELIKSLKKRVANEGRQLELLIEERKNAPPSNGYYRVYRAEVDNTYVAKPILKW